MGFRKEEMIISQAVKSDRRPIYNVTDMKRIGVRQPIFSYLRETWALRHFIVAEARGQAFQNSKGMILGKIWLVLEPFFNATIYLVVFGLVLRTGRGIDNILGYILVGSILFSYFQASLAPAATLMVQGKALIQSFTFPRATLVFAFALRNLYNQLPTMAMMLIMVIIVPEHAVPSVHWLGVPTVFVLQVIFNLGLSFFIVALTTRVTDLVFVWRLVSAFWLFTSGIFFSVARWVSHPVVAAIMEANPAYVLMTMARDMILYQQWPDTSQWLYFTVWAFGLLIVGFVLFWQNEESYGETIAR